MPNISVVPFAQLDEEVNEAGRGAYFAGRDAAHAEFERVATELAGDDQTLRRVLIARLQDAHLSGYRLRCDEDRARLHKRLGLVGPCSPPHSE